MPATAPAHPKDPFITVSIHAFVIDEIGEPVSDARVTVLNDALIVASASRMLPVKLPSES
jgi:hypothetical protein